MNKVVYVKAFFKLTGKTVTKDVPTGRKRPGIFGGERDITKQVTEWEKTGYSDCEIDGDRLSKDLSKAIDNLNENGYYVVSVTETTPGRFDWNYEYRDHSGGYGYGYGYSVTEGLIVVAKLAENTHTNQ